MSTIEDKKQQIEQLQELHKKGVVKGLKDVSGVQARKDIDVLMADDPDVFNLFLHAFKALKEAKADDIMGYYQIAGIHGLPRKLWDGVQGPLRVWDSDNNAWVPNVKGKGNIAMGPRFASGYCAHGVETFPTWHRPYMAMLEQSLFLKMVDLIKGATWTSEETRKRYSKAALRFRLPYWDYFRPREQRNVEFPGIIAGGVTSFTYDYRAPLILTEEDIHVRALGTDEPTNMKNPLLSFKFPDHILDDDLKAAGLANQLSGVETVRYPMNPNATIDKKTAFSQVLNSTRMDLNRVVLNMLIDSSYANYDVFASNRKYQPIKPSSQAQDIGKSRTARNASGSVEAIHGSYHILIGGGAENSQAGGGHMSRVPVAAFDPIFWMHHNHIERMFSVWQAVHAKDEKNWFVEIPGMAKESLYPFRKAAGTDFWTSQDSVSTETFGYTFTEIADSKGSKESLVQRIRDMYEWSVPLPGSTQKVEAPAIMKPIDVRETQFFKPVVSTKQAVTSERVVQAKATLLHHQELLREVKLSKPTVPDEGYSYEWFVDDEVERLAANGAFTIYYFVNKAPNTPAPPVENNNLLLEPALAGVTHIFAAPTAACDNCAKQEQQATVVTNTNAITSILLDYAEINQLQSLTPDHVVPFLKERLRWRIETISGDKRDPRVMHDQNGFKLNVTLKKARLPRGSGDAEYFQFPQIITDIVSRASAQADSH